MNNYIKVKEIAQILEVEQGTIYRALKRGELPAIRIGKLYRIPRVQFYKWLDGQTSGNGGCCGR